MIGVIVAIQETDRGILYHYQSPPGTATPREIVAFDIFKAKLHEAGEQIAKTVNGKLVDAQTGLPTNKPS